MEKGFNVNENTWQSVTAKNFPAVDILMVIYGGQRNFCIGIYP